MDRLEAVTGFKHRVTSAYHPQSNGLDERLNQTIKASLQKIVNEKKDDWDLLIDSVLFAYRTSKQDSVQYSPFYLMYGREPRLPVDFLTSHESTSDESSNELSFEDKVARFIEMKAIVHDRAVKNIEKAQKRQKRLYDQKHNCKTMLKVSSLVLTAFYSMGEGKLPHPPPLPPQKLKDKNMH